MAAAATIPLLELRDSLNRSGLPDLASLRQLESRRAAGRTRTASCIVLQQGLGYLVHKNVLAELLEATLPKCCAQHLGILGTDHADGR